MPLMTTKFDILEYLTTAEEQVALIEGAFEDGDPRMIAYAIGMVAKARGVTGVTIEDDPRLSTVVSAVRALGLRLTVVAKSET